MSAFSTARTLFWSALAALLPLLPHASRAQPQSQNTPLAIAAQAGDAQSVRALLADGANPLTRGELGLTPLALAFRSGSADSVAAILSIYGVAYLDPTLDARTASGKTALANGDLHSALRILDALVHSHPHDESFLFAYALACLSLRDFASAEFALNRIVASLNPDNLRARRELAHLYLLTGRPQQARRELQLLYADMPGSPMRDAVRADLAALAASRRSWVFALRAKAGFVHDDNANAGPSSDVVEIRPLQFGPLLFTSLRLAPESMPVEASGALYALDLQLSRKVAPASKWEALGGLGVRGHHFPDERNCDSRHSEAIVGLRRSAARSSSQLVLAAGQIDYGRDVLLRYAAARPAFLVAAGADGQWWWTTDSSVEFRHYDALSARDGTYAELAQTLRRFVGPSRHHLHAAAILATDQTDSPIYRYWAPAAEFGAHFVLPARLAAFGKIRWTRRDYSAREPLAPRERLDEQWTFQTGLRWRAAPRWEIEGGYQRIHTDSTFDLYDVSRDVFTLAVSCLLY